MNCRYAFCLALLIAPYAGSAGAVERGRPEAGAVERGRPEAATGSPQPIELFDAIDSGEVEAKFIALDAARANVLIENKTDRMMLVTLPNAIAAVPVLGQFGQPFGQAGGGGNGNGGGGGGGGSQSVGGGISAGGNRGLGNPGFAGGRGGGGRPGIGFGVMRIPPLKSRKLHAKTVCLEYGKSEPNPRLAYQMIPIGEFSNDQRLHSLCEELGRGDIGQKTAQAAAWHLSNQLSWERIAGINRIESRYLGNIKRFTTDELDAAKAFVKSFDPEVTAGQVDENVVDQDAIATTSRYQ